jgi:hypothetical protein
MEEKYMRTNRIRRVIAIALSLVLVAAFGGCKKKKDAPPEKWPNEVVATDNIFTRNQKSGYKIVISPDADNEQKFAAEELTYFIALATGCRLETIFDVAAVYDERAEYISVGNTSLYKSSGIVADAEKLGTAGFVLKSVGATVFISGSGLNGWHYGTVNGVYEFLKHTIGLEIYAEDCFDYRKNETVTMPAFNVIDAPDIDRFYFNYLGNSYQYMMRMRNASNSASEYWRLSGHSQMWVLEQTPEYLSHPEWLNSAGNALCYAATEMYDVYVRNLIQLLEHESASGTQRVFLGVPDMVAQANDQRSLDMMNELGTNPSGLMIVFLNYVVEKTLAHFAQKDPSRVLSFSTYAYEGVFSAPADYNAETDKYEPDNAAVVPHEKLNIMFTPIAINNTYPLTRAENKSNYESYKGWAAITKGIEAYMYNYYVEASTVTSPTFMSFPENIRMFAADGMKYYYEEGPLPGSPFAELKVYAQSKMCWDTELDYTRLAYDFIEHYYGPAADEMKKFYDFLVGWYAECRDILPASVMSAASAVYNENLWPEDVLGIQSALLDGAHKKNDALRASDPDSYLRHLWRIRAEEFNVEVNKLAVYGDAMTAPAIREIVDRIRVWPNGIRFGTKANAPLRTQTYEVWFENLLNKE